jgi:hypothetical protein
LSFGAGDGTQGLERARQIGAEGSNSMGLMISVPLVYGYIPSFLLPSKLASLALSE